MASKTRDDLIRELGEAKSILEKRFKVKRLALFGSWARGDQGPSSDIDVLVDVDPSVGLDFVTLADTLEQLLGARVDVVSSRAISPRHWKYIQDELVYV
jgi:uncharacterized protein